MMIKNNEPKTKKHQKRPRLCHADLAVLLDSVTHYIAFLKTEITQHEESETRFAKPNQWLQTRENLNQLLTNSKHIENKIATNLKGSLGRTKATKNLLCLTTEDKSGEYLSFVEACKLPFLRSLGFSEAQNLLFNGIAKGIIRAFRDHEERGVMKFKKIDVMRLAAYVEAHKR